MGRFCEISAYSKVLMGALLVAVMCAQPLLAEGPLRIDDFEDNDLLSQGGGKWITYSDAQTGRGTSRVDVSNVPGGAADTKRCLRIQGEITRDFQFGYGGARVNFNADGTPIDVNGLTGVRLWIRGNDDVYKVQLVTAAVTDYNEFSKPLVAGLTWSYVEIPFAELKQNPYWGKQVTWTGKDVRGIGFHTADGTIGEVYIEVDEIELY